MRRQSAELAAGQCQEHVTMTAEPPERPVTEGVRSLEVRWIFPADWRPVRKRRRISRFSLASGQIVARAPGLGQGPRCEVELTEVRTRGQDWWSLGFEATGPADLLRGALKATAALVSPRPCPVVWNSARMHPGPMRSGCTDGGRRRVTLTPDGCPSAEPTDPPCSPRPAPAFVGAPMLSR
ncbi:MAG TPA: hypothetical protein VMV92_03105 [Streptosporangiaceae bacterium]|nr:hypothetical protein [Streptosporangiaceae bacterium]